MFSSRTVGDINTAEAEALKTKRHFVRCVYPLYRKSLWVIMIAILSAIIHFLIVLLKSSTSLELPLREDMRVSEAINFNRRMRTSFIKPSNISARKPLSQLSNSKHFIKLRLAANLHEPQCNPVGTQILIYASSYFLFHKSTMVGNYAGLASPQSLIGSL